MGNFTGIMSSFCRYNKMQFCGFKDAILWPVGCKILWDKSCHFVGLSHRPFVGLIRQFACLEMSFCGSKDVILSV